MKSELWQIVDMPEWAVCYLEYGDEGDLSNEDMFCAGSWYDDLVHHVEEAHDGRNADVVLSYGEDRYLSSHPAFGLPATCVECTITVLW